MWWSLLFCLAFVAAFFLSGSIPPVLELDNSWSVVLEYAAEQRLRFGRDILFTYGPLGYLNASVGQGHLAASRVISALLWSSVVAWSLIGIARQVKGWQKYLLIGWFLIFSQFGAMEQHLLLVFAFAGIVLAGNPAGRRLAWLVLILVLALTSLVKFTFFMAAIAIILICVGMQLWQRHYREAAAIVIFYGMLLIASWLCAGQHPADLLPWLRGGIQISGGYTEAMSCLPQLTILAAGMGIVLMFLAALAVTARATVLTGNRAGLMLIFLLLLYLSWQKGFVRSDSGHLAMFFQSVPLYFALIFIIQGEEPLARRSRLLITTLYLGVISLALLGANLHTPGSMPAKLAKWPTDMLANARQLGQIVSGNWHNCFPSPPRDLRVDLPRSRSLIGNASIDLFNFTQWAALANTLNYRPRPVIQGYSAYNSYLQELDLNYYRATPPDYVLFTMETIDRRFPTLDDAPLLAAILANYVPITSEKGFLLLQRRQETVANVTKTLVHQQQLSFGETLDLTPWKDKTLFLSVSIQPTLLGKLVRLLFQSPTLFLYTHGDTLKTRYRFVPAMAETPFLLSPVLATNDDIVNFLAHGGGDRPGGIHFFRPAYTWGQLQEQITVRLYQGGDTFPPGAGSAPLSMGKEHHQGVFAPAPLSLETTVPRVLVTLDNKTGLLVQPPTRIVLPVPPGARQFTGEYGVMDKGNQGLERFGVKFTIAAIAAGGQQTVLLERTIPAGADSGALSGFRLPLEPSGTRELVLTTSAAIAPPDTGGLLSRVKARALSDPEDPLGHTYNNGDWGVWSGCRFQ
jgi:hypothetical protein